MNGLYTVMNPDMSSKIPYSTDFGDREGIEYVDVYSPPITTRYGEVYWTMMDPVPFPPEIVERFNSSVFAMVGYESDQVYRGTDGEPDQSVPIYHQYNHHYGAWIKGKDAEMVRLSSDQRDGLPFKLISHGAKLYYTTRLKADAPPSSIQDNPDTPSSQFISEANGGEFRKSFHGYPEGYAQLIESPTHFYIQPMQIDTKNRDHPGPGFVPGPLPKAAQSPPNASYSGILECPCTDRIVKKWSTNYEGQNGGICKKTIASNLTECSSSAVNIAPLVKFNPPKSVSDSGLPTGCVVQTAADGTATAVLNMAKSSVPCGSKVHHSKGSVKISAAHVTTTLELNPPKQPDNTILLTLQGPADKWFGVGFDAKQMVSAPYAIIVNGTGAIWEQKLDDHAPGKTLANSLTVVSNSVSNSIRTVLVSRTLTGKTQDHYTFENTLGSLDLIAASGSTGSFSYHGPTRGGATVTLLDQDGSTCVCNLGISGTINGIEFSKNCLPEPAGDLLHQKNPTCHIQDYVGGLSCCHHQNILLDKDQNPWETETMTYHMKFRLYFASKYEPKKITNLVRLYYQTEAWAGEYDVPKCPAGTPPEECVHQIEAHFTAKDLLYGCSLRGNPHCTGHDATAKGIKLIYGAPHCHAPSCISMELYNADTGELICGVQPHYGTGDVKENKFDEKDYLALPPCVWGDQPGLLEPPILSFDTNLTSIKRNNNTYGHYGEMASWQMRGVLV
eukprot:CAMPEP_0175150732 /NCGR_PEP_ID=MMETSP0087-20121206/18060_1 /TAXON_ID=136419 /ORGANISM="Unknown Unknown, Strain D1" /LENGTH=727 /DNA_ID=CAMNT_0016436763 /DNA_START=67 /DNA_END=2250 /DNA_ORIENTATION=+